MEPLLRAQGSGPPHPVPPLCQGPHPSQTRWRQKCHRKGPRACTEDSLAGATEGNSLCGFIQLHILLLLRQGDVASLHSAPGRRTGKGPKLRDWKEPRTGTFPERNCLVQKVKEVCFPSSVAPSLSRKPHGGAKPTSRSRVLAPYFSLLIHLSVKTSLPLCEDRSSFCLERPALPHPCAGQLLYILQASV